MSQIAVITGAGSGVGRATAILLGKAGWRLALVGRRESELAKTAEASANGPDRPLVCPCDIGRPEEVTAMADRVRRSLGPADALVNAAGTNIPKRSLAELSMEDYERMMNTNLHGAYYCAQAFLPEMRQRGAGTIVNVVSEAGLKASPKAGPSYVMAKFGMAGLNQAINAEERDRGIRACAIFPGDIDTPLLELRPNPPPPEAREKMLQSEDVARCILLALQLPQRAVVEELVIRPR